VGDVGMWSRCRVGRRCGCSCGAALYNIVTFTIHRSLHMCGCCLKRLIDLTSTLKSLIYADVERSENN